MKMLLVKEDLVENIWVRNVNDNNEPFGSLIKLPYEVWDVLNKKRIGKNLYEYEFPEEFRKDIEALEKRTSWLMEPQRLVIVLRVHKNMNPYDVKDMFILGDLCQNYIKEFPDCNIFTLRDDIFHVREIINMSVESMIGV